MPFNLKKLRRTLDKDRSGNKYLTKKELKLRRKQRKKSISKIAKKLRKGANPIPKNDPILEDVNPNPHNVDRTSCGSLKEDQVIKTKALKDKYELVGIDNIVRELLPEEEPVEVPPTDCERIQDLFAEFAELEDVIPCTNDDPKSKECGGSKEELANRTKSCIPNKDIVFEYNGDLIANQGYAKLLEGNKIEVRDAVFTEDMVGREIQVYGIEPKDAVLTQKDILKVVDKSIEQIEQQVRDEGNEDYKIDEAKFKRLFLIELNNFFPNKQVSLPEFNGGKFAKCGSSIVKKMADLDAVPK